MESIHVVPRLAPPVGGVGDYALLLADELRKAHGIKTRFIVANTGWQGPSEVNGFSVAKVSANDADSLLALLTRDASDGRPVLLHYVGYGYAKRGCPFWLVQALTKWRRRASSNRLITMFHELYARGPVLSSSFWNSPFQRWLATRLATLSDACATNMARHAQFLARRAPAQRGRIAVTPVFSTVGEAPDSPSLSARAPHLAIFGGARWQDDAFTKYRDALRSACELLQIERIITIGAPTAAAADFDLPVEMRGILPAAEVSRCLSRVRVGLLNYFSGYLGKSTIFAGYCAHGVMPLFCAPNHSEPDGLVGGRHYVVASQITEPLSPEAMQQIADQATEWYSGHSIAKTATRVAGALREGMFLPC